MRNQLKILMVILFPILFISTNSFSATKYKVHSIVDGDTFYIKYEGSLKKVRLLGIDAPESVSPKKDYNTSFGKKVSNYLSKKIKGKKISLSFDKQKYDAYGRLLAVCKMGNTNINELLLKKGYAKTYFIGVNTKYKKRFLNVEKTVKKNKVGIWKGVSTTNKAFSYVGSSSSFKVHKKTCRFAKLIKSKIYFKSLSYATIFKYASCSVCLGPCAN